MAGTFQSWMRDPIPEGLHDIRIQLRPRERGLILEALAGMSARSATPIEITACFDLAKRLEGLIEPRREIVPLEESIPYELEDRLHGD